MSDLGPLVSSTRAAYDEEVCAKAHKGVDPLSTEPIWHKSYPYGSSIGHLLLHVRGNLNHYVGTRIAQAGYARQSSVGIYRHVEAGKRRSKLSAVWARMVAAAISMARSKFARTFEPYSDPNEPRESSSPALKFKMDEFLPPAVFRHDRGQVLNGELLVHDLSFLPYKSSRKASIANNDEYGEPSYCRKL